MGQCSFAVFGIGKSGYGEESLHDRLVFTHDLAIYCEGSCHLRQNTCCIFIIVRVQWRQSAITLVLFHILATAFHHARPSAKTR